MKKNPYQIIRSKYVTEKSQILEGLKECESNRSVRRCESPKYVFLVHPDAKKPEIASALEEIYKERGIRVKAVNVVNVKPKKRRVRGRQGYTSGFRKAIVTLEKGDTLENL